MFCQSAMYRKCDQLVFLSFSLYPSHMHQTPMLICARQSLESETVFLALCSLQYIIILKTQTSTSYLPGTVLSTLQILTLSFSQHPQEIGIFQSQIHGAGGARGSNPAAWLQSLCAAALHCALFINFQIAIICMQ